VFVCVTLSLLTISQELFVWSFVVLFLLCVRVCDLFSSYYFARKLFVWSFVVLFLSCLCV